MLNNDPMHPASSQISEVTDRRPPGPRKRASGKNKKKGKTKKPFDKIAFIGIITLLLWISYLPYLYPTPFQPHEGLKRFAKEAAEIPEWLKEEGGFGGYNQSDIEAALKRDLVKVWFISLITCTVGIAAGILILKRKNSGRILAIGMAAIPLLIRAYSIIKSSRPLEHLQALYFLFLKKHPVMVIHNDIIAVIIFIGTIIYLLRPSIAKEFKTGTA